MKANYSVRNMGGKIMAITLHELVDQVREELLTPPQKNALEAIYPFLFVDEVELEVNVTVSSLAEGSGRLNVYVLEVKAGGEHEREQAHRVRIRMTPLLTKEEVREQLQQDKGLWARIQHGVLRAGTKDLPMVGEE